MLKWAMNSVIERQPQADPVEVEAFVNEHREKLLRYLDGKAPAGPAEPEPLDYVAQVLDEWFEKFPGCLLDDMPDWQPDDKLDDSIYADQDEVDLRERTFWFALYQLETVAEFPKGGKLHPYEVMMLENLEEVRELLRNRQELPDKYFATRPGEL
jgi:hypothetical protein